MPVAMPALDKTSWKRVLAGDIVEVVQCAGAFSVVSPRYAITAKQLVLRLNKTDDEPLLRNPMLELWLYTDSTDPELHFVVALDRTLKRDSSPPHAPTRNQWCLSVGISKKWNDDILTTPANVINIYTPLKSFVKYHQNLKEVDHNGTVDNRKLWLVWPKNAVISTPRTVPVDLLFQSFIAEFPSFTHAPETAYAHYTKDPRVNALGGAGKEIERGMIPAIP